MRRNAVDIRYHGLLLPNHATTVKCKFMMSYSKSNYSYVLVHTAMMKLLYMYLCKVNYCVMGVVKLINYGG